MAKQQDTNNKSVYYPQGELFLLETSIQIRKLWDRNLMASIEKLAQGNHLCSSNYVLFEFKAGLIHSLIKFHSLLRIEKDLSLAYGKWSNRYGRDQNYGHILTSIMTKIHKSIQADSYEMAIFHVEAVIFFAIQAFYKDIKRKLIGSFKSNELVKYRIKELSDIKSFENVWARNKFINLRSFFAKNASQFKQIKKFLENNPTRIKENSRLPKISSYLEEIICNVSKSEKHNTCMGISDAVIAVDTPKEYTLVSRDTAFPVLCEALNKRCELWKFKN